MTWLEQLLPPALVRALGWTLLHSLWQGAVVALALVGLLLLLRGHSARVRYATAAAALSLLLLLSLATFVRYYQAAAPAEVVQVGAYAEVVTESEIMPADAVVAPATTVVAPTGLQRALDYFDQNLPIIVLAWLLGLLAMTLRLLGGLAYVQRLRHYRVQPLGAEWQARLRALSERAGVRRSVALLESARVRVPLVVGHLRPVILLPLGTVTGLSQSYMEAILAHELAHVVRRDYLLNLLQSVAEILFFYHPAAWFITAVLRTERENCCDDVATALIGGNPLTVARALAALAEQSLAPRPTPQLALSAVGPDGSLLGRIRRLVRGRTAPTFAEGFLAACVVLAGLVLLSTAVVLARPQPAASIVVEMTTPNPADLPTEEVGEELPEAAATTAADEAPAAGEWSQEPLRILGFSPGGQALARVGTTQISFDTTRNQHMMRWSRQQAGGDGTVTIRRDKKGRLLELYVNGERVEIANAGTSAKDKQLEVIRLRDQPGAAPTGATTDREQRMEELALRMQQATLDGRPPSAADARKLSALALALATSREANGQPLNVNAITQKATAEAISAVDVNSIVDNALRQAETELKESLKNAQTDDEREQLQDQLDELNDRKQEMREQLREQQQELREQQQQMRQDAQQRLRDAQQAQRDAAQVRLDAQQAQRDAAQAQRDAQQAQRDQLNDELEAQLLADDLIKDTDNYQFTLTAKELTVNGAKQPAATQQKYRQLYERLSGRKLDGTRSIAISKGSSSSSTTTRGGRQVKAWVMPTPPTLPAPPAGPMGMVGPALPTPPLPPAPPDTEQLRNYLRADGLIGQNDKSFQFQLNSMGMKVNGKAQPAALADKYRRLYGGTESRRPGQQSKTTIQISVSE